MLSLGCVGQVFPDRWEQLVHGHLVQVQELSQFFPVKLGTPLLSACSLPLAFSSQSRRSSTTTYPMYEAIKYP